MEQKMTTHQVMFTPIKAGSDLASHNYIGQRSIRKQHVNYLAHEILEGRFRPGTAIAFCRTPEGKQHLVNGQHTLSAIVRAGRNIVLTVEQYFCKNMQEVAAIFATYDRQRTRSPSDIYSAYGLPQGWGFAALPGMERRGMLGNTVCYQPEPEASPPDDLPACPYRLPRLATPGGRGEGAAAVGRD